jgi:hypothetical protein
VDVPAGVSPKFQLYEVAPVEALASKLHVNPEQVAVKLATGGVGVALMNAEYSRVFVVAAGRPVMTPVVPLLTSALRTCAGVAVGLAWR